MTETAPRILIVDDEPAIRRFLRTSLTARGYTIYEAVDGQDALQAVLSHRPDLLVLDLGLPDLDGVQVTRSLREWTQIPIIILSVREQEADKIAALDAGADDYLTKPFGLGELLARIRVALRRQATTASEPVFRDGGLSVDLSRRLVTVDGREVQLTPTEYDLLRVLVTYAGRVITHSQLLHKVWGEGYEDMHLLRVNISNLRHKVEPDPTRPTYIHTEPGVGYRLRAKTTGPLDEGVFRAG
ncbi:MAG: DNA-binding response regulator [Chloroflexi bacterium RBG_16_57_11]|nr:MAG: DNA-binding response regulator [Chloroflexi bacterium RBG_16_57_11]